MNPLISSGKAKITSARSPIIPAGTRAGAPFWGPSSLTSVLKRKLRHRAVLPNRIRKSVGAENTFSLDLTSLDDMRAELGPLVDKVWHYCDTTGVRGRTVTLKVKFADFQIITRSRSRPEPISDCWTLASISAELLAAQ